LVASVKRATPRDYAVNVGMAVDKLVRAGIALDDLARTIRFRKPYHPVWSRDFTRVLVATGTYVAEARRHLEEAGLYIVTEALEYATTGLDNVYRFLKNLEGLCNLVRRQGLVVHPDPCKRAGDSKLKDVVLDFEKAVRFLQRRKVDELILHVDLVTLRDPLLYVRLASEHLSTFYSRCEAILGRKCTAYESEIADSLNLSLEALATDMAGRLEDIATLLAGKYGDLTPTIINNIPVAYHPMADPELLEAIVTWAHASAKLREAGAYAPADARVLVAVVMEDHAWIKLSAISGHYAHAKHPPWTIEHHSQDADVNSVLERLYRSRGFMAETTSYGLKVTVPPGKLKELKEALAILALSTSMDFRIAGKTLEEAYRAESATMDRLLGEFKML
jgi:hypothetical protein